MVNPASLERLEKATFTTDVIIRTIKQFGELAMTTGGFPSLTLNYEVPGECQPGELVPVIMIGLQPAACMNSTEETA